MQQAQGIARQAGFLDALAKAHHLAGNFLQALDCSLHSPSGHTAAFAHWQFRMKCHICQADPHDSCFGAPCKLPFTVKDDTRLVLLCMPRGLRWKSYTCSTALPPDGRSLLIYAALCKFPALQLEHAWGSSTCNAVECTVQGLM